LAFLEFLAPTLEEAIDRLASSCGRIVIVPMFIAQAGHLKRDVPVLVEAARSHHPGLSIDLAAPVGESDGVLVAIASYAAGFAAG
jgi:sirohydrochlorin cobaltochelatase